MSKVTDGFEENFTGVDGFGLTWRHEDVAGLLAHARALEEAMTILIDVVKSEKPRLDLSNFTKLLE